MSNFQIKLEPKERDPNNFPNFSDWRGSSLKNLYGKVVYMNADNPGIHIYRPYYIDFKIKEQEYAAFPLYYTKESGNMSAKITLENIPNDSHILFWIPEDTKPK